MTIKGNGFYWLHRQDGTPAVGRLQDGLWAIVGEGVRIRDEKLAEAKIEVGSKVASVSR